MNELVLCFKFVILICIWITNNRALQFTNEQLIELAKGCQKLTHVVIYFNFAITDKGITDGLFAHCLCIERVILYACLRIKDRFFTNLPATLKRLEIELREVVSILYTFSICFLYIWYLYYRNSFLEVILRKKEVEKNNTNSGYQLDSLRNYYLLFAINIATNWEITASGISGFNWWLCDLIEIIIDI